MFVAAHNLDRGAPNSSDKPSKNQAQGIGNKGFAKADDRHLSAAAPGTQPRHDGLRGADHEVRQLLFAAERSDNRACKH